MARRDDDNSPAPEKQIRVRRCRNDFSPTGQTLMQVGCCCCCCCLHMIGAIIGTGVGITGAYMRESFLEPHQRASDAAKRAVGAALALGFGGGIGIWMALYFVLELTVSSGELVLGIIAFAPGFAVIPMSIIVILIGFFIDQTNDTWAVSKDTSQPARANPLADPPPSLSALGSDQNTDSDLVSVKNWGGLKLAVRAAWLIFAGATLLSGLGWVLMSVMFG